jgi:hypothetical protein
LVAAVALLALALSPTAQAALLDANCPGPSATSSSSHVRDAQTFTALHTGQISRATLLINKSSAGGDFQLQILAANGSGPVNGVLAAATIPDATVPLGDATLDATFVSPVGVTAGQSYALVVTRPAGPGFLLKDRSGDACAGREFLSSSDTGTWAADDPSFDHIFQIFVNPPNAFTIGKLKGRKLHLNVPGPGAIAVVDASRIPGAVPAAGGKLLKTSKANATAAGDAVVKLRLTKRGKALLRQRGKLKARAEITFTPTGGELSTRRPKLKLKK